MLKKEFTEADALCTEFHCVHYVDFSAWTLLVDFNVIMCIISQINADEN